MGNQQSYRDLARMRRWPWKCEDVVRERFVHDDESCLYIALVRAYKLPQRWTFPVFEKLRWLSLMGDSPRGGAVAAGGGYACAQ